MNPIAFKSQMNFEPAPAPVSVAAIANSVYKTDATWQETLGDFSRLTYLKTTWRYDVRLNQASATGAATLKFLQSGNVVASVALDLTSAQRFEGSVDVDLQGVGGSSALTVELDVGTAGAAGTTAQVFSRLDVEFPMTVIGC